MSVQQTQATQGWLLPWATGQSHWFCLVSSQDQDLNSVSPTQNALKSHDLLVYRSETGLFLWRSWVIYYNFFLIWRMSLFTSPGDTLDFMKHRPTYCTVTLQRRLQHCYGDEQTPVNTGRPKSVGFQLLKFVSFVTERSKRLELILCHSPCFGVLCSRTHWYVQSLLLPNSQCTAHVVLWPRDNMKKRWARCSSGGKTVVHRLTGFSRSLLCVEVPLGKTLSPRFLPVGSVSTVHGRRCHRWALWIKALYKLTFYHLPKTQTRKDLTNSRFLFIFFFKPVGENVGTVWWEKKEKPTITSEITKLTKTKNYLKKFINLWKTVNILTASCLLASAVFGLVIIRVADWSERKGVAPGFSLAFAVLFKTFC